MMMVWARVGVRCCAVLVRVTLIVVITPTTFCTQPPWSLRGGTKHRKIGGYDISILYVQAGFLYIF